MSEDSIYKKIAFKTKVHEDDIISVINIFLDEIRKDIKLGFSIYIANLFTLRIVNDYHYRLNKAGREEMLLRQYVRITPAKTLTKTLKKFLDVDKLREDVSMDASQTNVDKKGFEKENDDIRIYSNDSGSASIGEGGAN